METSLEQMNKNEMRENLINLEKKLDADIFVYYGEIMNGVEGDVKSIIEDLVRDNKKDTLFVILTTPGAVYHLFREWLVYLENSIQK